MVMAQSDADTVRSQNGLPNSGLSSNGLCACEVGIF